MAVSTMASCVASVPASFAATGSWSQFGAGMAAAVGRTVGVAVGVAGASVALGEADAVAMLGSSVATKREPGPEHATRMAARARGVRRSGDLMNESLLAGRRAVKVHNRTFSARKSRPRCQTGAFFFRRVPSSERTDESWDAWPLVL